MRDGRLSLTAGCRSHDGLHALAKFQPQRNQITKAGHLQPRYIPHHPVTEASFVACTGPSETGYSLESWYSSRSAPLQSSRSPRGAVENRYLPQANETPVRRVDWGCSPLSMNLETALDWTLLDVSGWTDSTCTTALIGVVERIEASRG